MSLPEFGMPRPEIPAALYPDRPERPRVRAARCGDVLSFSKVPAYLPPFLRRPDHAMTLAR